MDGQRQPKDIHVMVVSETNKQRLAFSDTVQGCGFNLVDCVSKEGITDKHREADIDIWLVDSQYDGDIISMIDASQPDTVLVGFSEAPFLNETQLYGKWQRKLKRKLAHMLNMPELLGTKRYEVEQRPWQYVVFLGASMGGPTAIKTFLDNLSVDLPICILIAHHFNPKMIHTLPRVLNRHNKWRCQVISTTQSLQTGHCLIVPIEQQVICDSTGRIILHKKPWVGEYKPNIGQLLKNASDVYGSELIAIIFSGMGNDGSQYLDQIQQNHSQIWAQDLNDSACISQPQAIIDSGYCQYVGTAKQLAHKLTEYINDNVLLLTKDTHLSR